MTRVFLRAMAVAVCLVVALEARAWKCTRAEDSNGQETGPSLAWRTRSLTYTLDSAGTQDIPGSDEFAELERSFEAWEGLSECVAPYRITDIEFTRSPAFSQVGDKVGYDYLRPHENENLLIFRDETWPLPGQAASTVALCTTTYRSLTGELIDADIEFNSALMELSTNCDCPMPSSCNCMDLMNAAVHEIGHFLGLNHSLDSNATMYESAGSGETKKRTPECDDRNGVVFKYPEGEDNGYCEEGQVTSSCGYCAPPRTLSRKVSISVTGMGGCQALPGPVAAIGLAFAAVAVALRRRVARK